MAAIGDYKHSVLSRAFSRRNFLAQTSCFVAYYALAKTSPLPSIADRISR